MDLAIVALAIALVVARETAAVGHGDPGLLYSVASVGISRLPMRGSWRDPWPLSDAFAGTGSEPGNSPW